MLNTVQSQSGWTVFLPRLITAMFPFWIDASISQFLVALAGTLAVLYQMVPR